MSRLALEHAWIDFRVALRHVRRRRVTSLFAALTLALGTGAAVAIWSVVSTVLIEPLPYGDTSRLVMIWNSRPDLGRDSLRLSEPEVLDYRRASTKLDELGCYGNRPMVLTLDERSYMFWAGNVEPQFFQALKTVPFLGRLFDEADVLERDGRVVVVGHAFWRDELGGDADILGRELRLNEELYEVIGVLPPGFYLPTDYRDRTFTPMWIPQALDPRDPAPRFRHDRYGVGRLAAGVTLFEAQAELSALVPELTASYPKDYPPDSGFEVRLTWFDDEVRGPLRTPLTLLLVAVLGVLGIAWINVATLFLAGVEGRRRELAMRGALGAGRLRLARQLLMESTLIAIAGGILGFGAAHLALRAITAVATPDLPRLAETTIDVGSVAFAVAASVLGILGCAVAPIRVVMRTPPALALRGAGIDAGSAKRRWRRRGLISAEVALSFLLLIGGTLLVRSILALHTVDPGFEAENLLTGDVTLPVSYKEQGDFLDLYSRILDRVKVLPGVVTAAVSSSMPVRNSASLHYIHPVEARDLPVTWERQGPLAGGQWVSEGSFRTLGIPLLEGRDFTAADHQEAKPVAIVNRALAQYLWGEQDALGRQIRMPLRTAPRIETTNPPGEYPWREVIGVVGNVRDASLGEEPILQLYLPLRQNGWTALRSARFSSLLVRTSVRPESLIGPVRQVMRELEPDSALGAPHAMEELVRMSVSVEGFAALLLGILAAVAFILTIVGIAGVFSYMISQRTAEFGVRMAFGASAESVLRMVLIEALLMTFFGLLAGGVAALGSTRFLGNLLHGVPATDPVTFVAVAAALLVATAAASWTPAWRASRVDPAASLHVD